MKNAQKSLVSFIILTVLGLAGLLYALLILPRDNYQQGLIYGITSGFLLTGVAGIFYSIYLMRNPHKAREAQLSKNEERTQFIRMKTASSSAQVILILECLATLVLGLQGYREISVTIAAVAAAQMLVAGIFAAYYSRKF